MGSKKNKHLAKWKLLTVLFLSLLFIFILVYNQPTVFSITATTEIIEFKTTDDDSSKIPLYNAKVYNYNTDSTYLFSGSFKLNTGVLTRITRVAKGPISIQVESLSDRISAGAFYSEEDEFLKDAGNFVEFSIDSIVNKADKGETITIPMSGDIELGRTINYESYGNSSAIVRSGKVILLGRTFFRKKYYKSTSYNLNIGDQFSIQKPLRKAYGFVTINENSAMTVAYKVFGKRGRIITPGPMDKNSGYYLSRSILSRIQNDPLAKSISLTTAILISFITIFPLFKNDFFK